MLSNLQIFQVSVLCVLQPLLNQCKAAHPDLTVVPASPPSWRVMPSFLPPCCRQQPTIWPPELILPWSLLNFSSVSNCTKSEPPPTCNNVGCTVYLLQNMSAGCVLTAAASHTKATQLSEHFHPGGSLKTRPDQVVRTHSSIFNVLWLAESIPAQ